jgi:hypothetical protein
VAEPVKLETCDKFNADLVAVALSDVEQFRLNQFLQVLLNNPYSKALLAYASSDTGERFEKEISYGVKFIWRVQQETAQFQITSFPGTTIYMLAIRRE